MDTNPDYRERPQSRSKQRLTNITDCRSGWARSKLRLREFGSDLDHKKLKLALADIPFFSTVSGNALELLKTTAIRKYFSLGSIKLRTGPVSRRFYAIGNGAVWVQSNCDFGSV